MNGFEREMDLNLLTQMKTAHAEVLRCIGDMEAITAKTICAEAEYTAARFRISRAGLARRTMFNRICHHLRSRADAESRQAVAKVAELDRQLLSSSTTHVRAWTAERIRNDWRGYCAASNAIRAQMIRELRAEEELLFPFLDRQIVTEADRGARAA